MTKILIFPHTLGFNVKNVLFSVEKLVVQGVTTKGIFINTSQDALLFLSYETHHGPNTLNFPGRRHAFQVEIGEMIRKVGDILDFKNFQISLAEPCRVWQPAQAVQDADLSQAYDRLILLGRQVYKLRPDAGFAIYLPFFLEGQLFNDEIGQKLTCIRDAKNYETILMDVFPGLLGWGRGLTPSGDDLIAGFLLFVSRALNGVPYELVEILPAFLKLSKNKTTTLANNIIEGAANGIGDERLLALVDYSQGSSEKLENLATGLLSYGSSSGIDTLLGMMSAAQRFR